MVSVDAEALWAAVEVSYDADGLITLTNIRDRSATAIDETAGEDAAQGVIDLWPVYAQAAYDATNATHVEIAKRATVAMLWQRGGSSTNIAKVEWDEVWGDNGLVGRLRKSEARAHASPSSNSGTVRSTELLSNGQQTMPWSDPASYPIGLRSTRRPVHGD